MKDLDVIPNGRAPCGHTWRKAGPCPHCHPPPDARKITPALDRALREERARCERLVDLHISDREDAHSLKRAIRNGD